MLAVAVPAPLRPTLLAVHSCTRQHANLLVSGQIVSGLVATLPRAAARRAHTPCDSARCAARSSPKCRIAAQRHGKAGLRQPIGLHLVTLWRRLIRPRPSPTHLPSLRPASSPRCPGSAGPLPTPDMKQRRRDDR
jgi:hypothetical protein